MRMWMLPTNWMCGRHRSGEHNEIHKHLPSMYRGISIAGRMEPVAQIQLNALQTRHDELAESLSHGSPLDVDDYLIWKNYPQYFDRKIDFWHNVRDISNRCPDCRALVEKHLKMGRNEMNMNLFAYAVGITDIYGNDHTDTIYAENEAAAIAIAHENPQNADVWMVGRTSENRKL